MNNKKIFLVQQGAWDMAKETLPLASAYLKAFCEKNDKIRQRTDITLKNFNGGIDSISMASELFRDLIPDVIGFSVQGWNFKKFCEIASIFKQIKPQGLVIFGGPHVSYQAKNLLKQHHYIDIIVNGEGEETFLEILEALIDEKCLYEFKEINGVSFNLDNEIITTPARDLIDINRIPSPYLNGVIELLDENNQFKYDVALLETNRGCPYGCSYCNWGGATGSKIRRFSISRLIAELDFLGKKQIETLVLCDSNFGDHSNDAEFVDALINTKDKYGYPKNFETSWCKNKSDIFLKIIKKLKNNNLNTSFTVALQTLNQVALKNANRINMDLNEHENYIKWLNSNGFECYGELIWGLPGETYASFLKGYDILSKYVEKIAVYPLLLIPNTKFYENKKDFKIIAAKRENNDFEYIFSHASITLDDNLRMYSFIFWARILSENLYFSSLWLPLKKMTNITQSQVIKSFELWFTKSKSPILTRIKQYSSKSINSLNASEISNVLKYMYENSSSLKNSFKTWWVDIILPQVETQYHDFFTDLFDYEYTIKPIFASIDQTSDLEVELNNDCYIRRSIVLNYDFPTILKRLACNDMVNLAPKALCCDIIYKKGFINNFNNQEFIKYFIGKVINCQEIEKSQENLKHFETF